MTHIELITGLEYIKKRAEISGDIDAYEAAYEAIKALETPTSWVLTKDEIPDRGTDILIAYKYHGRLVTTRAQRCDTGSGYVFDTGGWIPDNIVVAWMSFPQYLDEDTEESYGEWIPIQNSRGTTVAQRCSKCGDSPKKAIKSKYCPNCGAPMKDMR